MTTSDPTVSKPTAADLSTAKLADEQPTAAVVLIGNELLSGRTQDTNLAYMATRLASHGVRVSECRIIPDIETVIVDTLTVLSQNNTYVFTTGGIGPTHDDITADCVARTFNVPIDVRADAKSLLMEYWQTRNIEPNEDRLRMARIPEGATLILNPVSAAPGFCLKNVYVMAGVPRIMQAMFDSILPQLQRGLVIDSVSVQCDLGEGTIAGPLRALQQQYANVDIGSYPGKRDGKFSVMLVARGTNTDELAGVEEKLRELVANAGGNVI